MGNGLQSSSPLPHGSESSSLELDSCLIQQGKLVGPCLALPEMQRQGLSLD